MALVFCADEAVVGFHGLSILTQNTGHRNLLGPHSLENCAAQKMMKTTKVSSLFFLILQTTVGFLWDVCFFIPGDGCCLKPSWPQDVTSVPWKSSWKGIYLVMQNWFLKEERSVRIHVVTPTVSNKIRFCRGGPGFIMYNQSRSELKLSLKKRCRRQVKPLNLTAQSCYLIAPEEKSPWGGVNNQYQILFFFHFNFLWKLHAQAMWWPISNGIICCSNTFLARTYLANPKTWV